ncbi:NAD(P)-binding domain-containing protein [Artemisia annua]|uniref:NAD(P)-binding domain-containing protein n=1 Tax=Artemisia annua TaxID=35608 RepID=A0A2U1LK97_ARTAN|nr:NAD(P)-binding domain-containing protein [Artemisia annua]
MVATENCATWVILDQSRRRRSRTHSRSMGSYRYHTYEEKGLQGNNHSLQYDAYVHFAFKLKKPNSKILVLFGVDNRGSRCKVDTFVPQNNVSYILRIEGNMVLEAHEGLHPASSYLEHLNVLAAVTVDVTKIPDVDLQAGFNALAIGVATQISVDRDNFVSSYEVFS